MHDDRTEQDRRMDARALGAAKLEARGRRRRSLRRRVASAAGLLFIAAWAALFGQSYLQSTAGAGAGSTTAIAAAPATTRADDEPAYEQFGDDEGEYAVVIPQRSTPAPTVTTTPAPAPAPVTTSQS